MASDATVSEENTSSAVHVSPPPDLSPPCLPHPPPLSPNSKIILTIPTLLIEPTAGVLGFGRLASPRVPQFPILP
jgi:hypothetical protein